MPMVMLNKMDINVYNTINQVAKTITINKQKMKNYQYSLKQFKN